MSRLRVRFQTSPTDCAATCVEIALSGMGLDAHSLQIREQLSGGRDGNTALDIVAALETVGVVARGVSISASQVNSLTWGAILHWHNRHFVVFDRQVKGGVIVVDPAVGRRFVSWPDFTVCFSGTAIILPPKRLSVVLRLQSTLFFRAFWGRNTQAGDIATSLSAAILSLVLPITIGFLCDFGPEGRLPILVTILVAVRIITSAAIATRSHTRNLADIISDLNTALERRFGISQSQAATARATKVSVAYEGVRSLQRLFFELGFAGMVIILAAPRLSLLAFALAAGCAWLQQFSARSLAVKAEIVEAGQRDLTRFLANVEYHPYSYDPRSFDYGSEARRFAGLQQHNAENYSFVSRVLRAANNNLMWLSPLVFLTYGASLLAVGDVSIGGLVAATLLVEVMLAASSQIVLSQPLVEPPEFKPVLEKGASNSGSLLADLPDPQASITLTVNGFSYTSSQDPILRDVTLEVPGGKLTAILGNSGAGKTTLLRILSGALPFNGSLRCGSDILPSGSYGFANSVLYLSSEPKCRSGISVLDYLYAYTTKRNDAALIQAAQVTGIDKITRTFTFGYYTKLDEDARNMSHGERQRLQLALAVLSGRQVLLLDVATSALSPTDEADLLNALRSTKRTIVVVPNHASSAICADQTYVVGEGHVTRMDALEVTSM